MTRRVAFRTDAAPEIGTGHVMRCLTLAREMRAEGWDAVFLCGARQGNLAELIRASGFDLVELAAPGYDAGDATRSGEIRHAHWLGSRWQDDADATRAAIADHGAELLIVDHYALDRCWEERTCFDPFRIAVIDDLADRVHRCALLIDANLGREAIDYRGLVPEFATVATGVEFACLRPEFARLRSASLERRREAGLRSILIAMGGVDAPNASGEVLRSMRNGDLPSSCRIHIVLGTNAMWLPEVRDQAAAMQVPAQVLVGVDNMAELMADADLAIGGAGVTAWERCCLGLPSLIVVIADNQVAGAQAIHRAGAGRLIGTVDDVAGALPSALAEAADRLWLSATSRTASALCDGMGARRVVSLLEALP